MICFSTSRMDVPDTGKLNSANHFIDELRLCFPNPCRALDICSNPDGWETMDHYASITKKMFEEAGFAFERFQTLDSRNERLAAKLVQDSNLLILSGGHVPTQNHFFNKICLRDLLKNYEGIVIGISAGSMNSADVVYAQPEEEGEAIDPAYQRFLTGLNLTKTNLLPHQENKDDVLDGLKIYGDIACPDSMGKTFYAIPDGSYLFVDECKKEELRGEAYMVRDGSIRQISAHGEVTSL